MGGSGRGSLLCPAQMCRSPPFLTSRHYPYFTRKPPKEKQHPGGTALRRCQDPTRDPLRGRWIKTEHQWRRTLSLEPPPLQTKPTPQMSAGKGGGHTPGLQPGCLGPISILMPTALLLRALAAGCPAPQCPALLLGRAPSAGASSLEEQVGPDCSLQACWVTPGPQPRLRGGGAG